jgi:hypothetical protein
VTVNKLERKRTIYVTVTLMREDYISISTHQYKFSFKTDI